MGKKIIDGRIYWFIVDNDTSDAEICSDEEEVIEALEEKDEECDMEELSVMKVQVLEEFDIESKRKVSLLPVRRK
jgi:hypothetical protein